MKGSIFDKSSGAFVYYGAVKNAKYKDFQGNGHISVENVKGIDPWLKWDFSTGTVVLDTARIAADEQKNQDKADRSARRDEIKAELLGLYQNHTGQNTQAQVDLLNEFIRL